MSCFWETLWDDIIPPCHGIVHVGRSFLTLDIFHSTVELVRLITYSHNMTGHEGEPAKTLLLCKIHIIFGIAPAMGCPVVKYCILHQ